MNLKAIIASLVLGSSSLAMAAPGVTVTAQAPTATVDFRGDVRILPAPAFDGRPTMRPVAWDERGDHRDDRWSDRRYRGPVSLASDLHFAGDGRTFITVGRDYGRFSSLQLSAGHGRTHIQQVYVQFENGQEQVIRNINRTLDRREALTLDLDGNRRAIKRIVVYGNDLNNRGWRRAAGTFSVTAL